MNPQRRGSLVRATLILYTIVVVLLSLYFSPVEYLAKLYVWINGFSSWGAVGFFFFYILAVVVLVPGSLLALVAGVTYGMWGLPLALVAATLGAIFSFLIARHLGHRRIRQMTLGNLLLRTVERKISEGGWRSVVVARLNPLLPFNLQNYFFGLTNIRFRHYLLATFFGIFPGLAVNVSIGAASAAISLAELQNPINVGLVALSSAVAAIVGWQFIRRPYVSIAPNVLHVADSE